MQDLWKSQAIQRITLAIPQKYQFPPVYNFDLLEQTTSIYSLSIYVGFRIQFRPRVHRRLLKGR
jgi:hypothetical protein